MTVAVPQLAATPKRYSFFNSITDYNVFVEIDGSGPCMIMTHGLGASTNVFQPLMVIFSSEYTVVRIDWPGLGHSSLSKTGTKITMASLFDVLGGVMDVLEISSAVLVGHSLGGIVSMMVSARSPERVKGLAVIGAGRTRSAQPNAKAFTLELARQAREDGIRVSVDAKVGYNIPSKSPALSRALLRAITASTNPEGYAQICEALCDDSHVDPDYSHIVCPTSVISGKYDAISPVSVSDDLVEVIATSGKRPSLHILKLAT